MRRSMVWLAGFVLVGLTPAMLCAQVVLEKQAQFPTRLGLEKKWTEFQEKPATPASVAALLREDLLVPICPLADARYSSLWASIDRKVAGDENVLKALREAQEPQAHGLVKQVDDLDRLMGFARKYPWAPSVHQALLRAGTRELQLGHAQLAMRCFRDIMARSADADLCLKLRWASSSRQCTIRTQPCSTLRFKGSIPRRSFPGWAKRLPPPLFVLDLRKSLQTTRSS